MSDVARKILPGEMDERAREQPLDEGDARHVPMTEWQRQIIAERLAEYRDGLAGPGRTWEQVRQALRMKLATLRR